MKEQVYIIDNNKTFEPKHIFDCGQCFRWNIEDDESYTGVFGNNVLNVKKEGNKITFKGICEKDIKQVVEDYFDFNTNYEKIKEKLANVDEYLKQSIEFGNGIRILNQDLWETIISFIISANNNIPRIKGIIERISKKYGKKIEWSGKEYYTFPTIQELSEATVEDFRALGLGFRDKRIYETTKIFIDREMTIEELIEEQDVNKLREKLLTLPGVGPKVADCIMLFGLKRFEVFPIDVWVRRVMNDLYIKNEDETKVKNTEIEKLAVEKYSNLAGLAQQYLFYWRRETA
ncbi:MAG: 8-oxoguanine DNA glycosylase [Clostridia bacterium]|nr:8-oxoguanine DNA glycosylase [Clostridia bacterium]